MDREYNGFYHNTIQDIALGYLGLLLPKEGPLCNGKKHSGKKKNSAVIKYS